MYILRKRKVASAWDTECDYCPAGEYYNPIGCEDDAEVCSTAECATCPIGQTRTEDQRSQWEPVFTGIDIDGNPIHTSCWECSYPEYQIGDDHTQCISCGAGEGYSETQRKCETCIPGKYSDDEFECKSCPAGSFSDDPTTCELCVRGKYSEEPDQTSCEDCGMGTYSPFTGADSATSCIPCAAGTYQDDRGSRRCKECPSGFASDPLPKPRRCLKSCPAGEKRFGKTCKLCGSREYSEEGTGDTCKTCPAGTESAEGSCTVCPDGEYFNPDLVRLSGPHGDILTKYKTTDFDITTVGDKTWLQLPGEHPWEEIEADCSPSNAGSFLSYFGTDNGYGEFPGSKGDEHAKLSTYLCSQRCQDDDKFFVYMHEHEQYCGCGACILDSSDGVTQYKKPDEYPRRNTINDFSDYSFLTSYENRMQSSDTCQPCPAGSVSTLDRTGCESRKGDFYHTSDTGITGRSPKIVFQDGDNTDYTVEVDGILYKDPDIRVCKGFKVYRNFSGHPLAIDGTDIDGWNSNGLVEEDLTIDTPGEYDYYCIVTSHSAHMRGKIIVEDCQEQIVPCEVGYHRERGLCTPCPKGQTSNGITCTDCDDYQTSLGDGQCISCPRGTGYQNCERCPAGRFSDEEGIDCKDCQLGTFSTEDRTACTDDRDYATCDQGQYLFESNAGKYPGTCDKATNKCTPDITETKMLTCESDVPAGYKLVDVKGYGNLYKAELNQANGPSAGFKDTPSGAQKLDIYEQPEDYVPSAFKSWQNARLPEETLECHDDVRRLDTNFTKKVTSVCNTDLTATQCEQYANRKSLDFGNYTALSGTTNNYDYDGCFELDSKIYEGTGYILDAESVTLVLGTNQWDTNKTGERYIHCSEDSCIKIESFSPHI